MSKKDDETTEQIILFGFFMFLVFNALFFTGVLETEGGWFVKIFLSAVFGAISVPAGLILVLCGFLLFMIVHLVVKVPWNMLMNALQLPEYKLKDLND